jgi:hypothetical protein
VAKRSDVSRRSPSLKAGLFAILSRFPVQSQPTVLALLFALPAWPLVALTLGAVDTTESCSKPPMLPISDVGRWAAAAGAVFVSALIASSVTSRLVKGNRLLLALETIALALLVAIPVLPLLPNMLGQHVGAGAVQAIDCWDVAASSQAPLWADLLFPLAPIVEPLPVLILVIGVWIWAGLVTEPRRRV